MAALLKGEWEASHASRRAVVSFAISPSAGAASRRTALVRLWCRGAHRWRRLRLKQREVNHIQPAQDAVYDRPEDRMVGGVADRDGEGAAKNSRPTSRPLFEPA